MRRRLTTVILSVLAVAIVAFAVPLALVTRTQLTDQALDELQTGTVQAATFLEDRSRTCAEAGLLLQTAARSGPSVALFDRAGELVFFAGSSRLTAVPPDVRDAQAGRIGRAVVDGRLSVSVPVASQVCGAPLVLHASVPSSSLEAAIQRAWWTIAGVAVIALLVAALVSRLLATRLARPLQDLASSARRLGDGDFSARAPRSGIPESDAIAEALDVTADRLGASVARGRAFTADASHQLRTPLTALRLHLESFAPDRDADRIAQAAALEEADRLDATIRELVSLTRPAPATAVADLVPLLRDRLPAWQRRAGVDGRTVTLQAPDRATTVARPAAISQAVEILVDNAIVHGTGAVVVSIETNDAGPRIAVRDEGPGPGPGQVPDAASHDRGTRLLDDAPVHGGRGLVLARSLVEAERGRLVLESADDGWRACLVLPPSPAVAGT